MRPTQSVPQPSSSANGGKVGVSGEGRPTSIPLNTRVLAGDSSNSAAVDSSSSTPTTMIVVVALLVVLILAVGKYFLLLHDKKL